MLRQEEPEQPLQARWLPHRKAGLRSTNRRRRHPVRLLRGPHPPPSGAGKVVEVPVAGRKLWKILVPANVILVAVAIAGVFYFRTRQTTHRLTDKDTIVLADFNNETGDPVFDDTLKTALSVALNQSPFLNVLPENKVTSTLQMMSRPAGTKLTPEVARELCQRAGSKAYLVGSIVSTCSA